MIINLEKRDNIGNDSMSYIYDSYGILMIDQFLI